MLFYLLFFVNYYAELILTLCFVICIACCCQHCCGKLHCAMLVKSHFITAAVASSVAECNSAVALSSTSSSVSIVVACFLVNPHYVVSYTVCFFVSLFCIIFLSRYLMQSVKLEDNKNN